MQLQQLFVFDTDNSGNVKKTPAVSAYCQSKAYIYVAKINNNGAWQWVKVAGGSTTGSPGIFITHTNNSVYIAGNFLHARMVLVDLTHTPPRQTWHIFFHSEQRLLQVVAGTVVEVSIVFLSEK